MRCARRCFRELAYTIRIAGNPGFCQTSKPATLGGTLQRMTEAHLSPQAYERLRQELEERSTTRRREISLWIERGARARRHQRERRLRRGQERAGPQRSARPPARSDAEERGRDRHFFNAVRSSSRACSWSCATTATTTPSPTSSARSRSAHETYDVLSTDSPLGQALLGAGPGATVRYQGPRRELGVTVVAVRPLT